MVSEYPYNSLLRGFLSDCNRAVCKLCPFQDDYVAFGHDQSYNVAIPVTILFMALQRYYVEGVTGGAVKG